MSESRLKIETQSFDHLTNRQVEIVRLLALGLMPSQIAEKLFISVKTVETHKSKIFKKLDAHRIVDLVWVAIKCGIVKIEDWERMKNTRSQSATSVVIKCDATEVGRDGKEN